MGNTGIHGTCLSSREDATSRPVSTCARPWSPSWSVILLTLTAQLQTPNRGALILGNFCRRRHTDSRELCAVVRSCMMAPPCEQSSIRSDSPPCIGRGAGGRAKHRRSGLRVQREPPWDRRHEPEAQLESGHHRARVDAERLPHPSGKQLVRSERRTGSPAIRGKSSRPRHFVVYEQLCESTRVNWPSEWADSPWSATAFWEILLDRRTFGSRPTCH